MKKLVQITPTYWPHLGGVETHVYNVNRELLSQGFEITVLTTQHESDLAQSELHDGVEIKRLPKNFIDHKLATWKWIWQQRQLLLTADIIHLHDVVWWLYPFILFFRSKTYATFHGWEGIFPVPWKNKIQRRLNSWFVHKKMHVGAWIQEFYGDRADAVVYGGLANIAPLSVKAVSPKVQIVFLGRLEAVNEVPLYLELCRLLKKSGLPITMTWVGEGAYRLPCQTYGTVTGMVTHPEQYLATADIVFANSYLSILEAQARGKLVVSLYSNPLKKAYLDTFPGKEWMIMAPTASVAFDQLQVLLKSSVAWKALSKKVHQFAAAQTWKKIANVYQKIWSL